MGYAIGIDTGGTYTDAVLCELPEGRILCSAKSLTTHRELTAGILGALSGLERSMFSDVELVCLSTTLATNACVEGRGCRAALIMLGCEPGVLHRYGSEYGLPPADEIILTPWGLSQEGELQGEVDWDAFRADVVRAAESVDAFALSAQWGIKNPAFEREACRRVEQWTGRRVICAGELSNMPNMLKRAATALLNARLIPIIDGFIRSIKEGMGRLGIAAPVVIVRGDGGLMTEAYASVHPVETLFSGPAASVTGGIALSGEKDCIIVDVGGTTTDMAVARGGDAEKSEDGLSLGGFRTCTRAVRAFTVGLGGDSRIRHNTEGGLDIGPRRAVPLSHLALLHPEVMEELRMIRQYGTFAQVPWSEFLILQNPDFTGFSDIREQLICRLLSERPKSVGVLAGECDLTVYETNRAAARLEDLGVLMRAALTPTDIMHVRGIYTPFCIEAAQCGVADLAFQLEITPDELCERIFSEFSRRIFEAVSKMLLTLREGPVYEQMGLPLERMLRTAWQGGDRLCDLRVQTELTLVGIGAPTYVFLPAAAERFGCRWICPEHAGVANAYGAVSGSVTAEHSLEVSPVYSAAGLEGYRVFADGAPEMFPEYESALASAEEKVRLIAAEKVRAMGADSCEVFSSVQETTANVGYTHTEDGRKGHRMTVSTRVIARAAGRLQVMP